ncbi:crossover junction endonuclease MUS81-like isoform X2 [Portunus trituberculatus]|uniref:crossover junction endonuclease MUS81-like isoform X2 n=1 Tax=Portunus trituberculatus TaxID=210409 RepID=UPI001E1CDA80|nr:crossover junction endonuclease MUS81-like isoform X2 [Portunus trituberculatus]
MSDEGKKKWRTKRIIEHANPLFECWLGEWQQEAEKRGSNMKYNFQRARKSLSLYPLPLYTGQDCKLLAHFGNKICQMLDRRLAQHEEEFGPTDWTQVHKIKEIQKKRQRKKTVGPAIDAIPTSQSPLGNEESPRKKRSRTKNCYIPVLRSGAYALLMTLHQACFKSHYQGFMKKEELVAAAQPLCDVSLSKPDHVGSYYTGWSAMKTLTKKGLVLRQSHPPRFSITEEGKTLALKLERAENSNDQMECVDPSAATSLDIKEAEERSCIHSICTHTLSSSSDGDDEVEEVNGSPSCSTMSLAWSPQSHSKEKVEDKNACGPRGHSAVKSLSSPSDLIKFSYVTIMGMETPLKDNAAVTVEEDGFLGFLIKCIASDLQESGLHYRMDHTRTAPAGFIYVFLSNECAPSQCVGLNKVAAQSQVSPPSVTISKPARTKSLSQHTSGSEATDASSLKARTAQSQTENKKKVLPCISSVPASSASLCMPFTLLPGSFEVILCIDNAETSGKSAGVQPSNKDIILSELKRNGVKYSIRKLHVGDYLWVCQENQGTLSTDLGVSAKETRELVLPVVVERKRMDDLAASIKDGRFREQKFRLRQCGLSHPVYLVEEHQGSVAAGHSLPEMTCLQAIVNTQIINEFTVKVVKGQRESAAYLTIMTRYLQSKYQNQCVRSAQLQDIDGSQTDISSVIETCLLPFTEFNTASMKNQQLTVKEMFAKHLLQLHGVSADKARAVVDKYETPNQLLAAYEEEGSIGAKKLLADLKWGKTSRNLGQVLSANIASLYTSNVLH